MKQVSAVPMMVASLVVQAGRLHTYDEFMSVRPEDRHEVFARLSAEKKSELKREHVQRWLSENRSGLTSEQVALVNQAMAFLSADYYARPEEPENRRREEALRKQLERSLGRRKVADAMTFRGDLVR